jgi:hypothetical protein
VLNAILFKGTGNDVRVVSPMLAGKYNKLAVLVLKTKVNLSSVPALDNMAPYLNCGMVPYLNCGMAPYINRGMVPL